MDRSPSNGPNKAKQPEVIKIGEHFIDPFYFYTFSSVLGESVRKRHESVRVYDQEPIRLMGSCYDAFVEDKSVAFGACDDFEMLGGRVSPEEIGVDYIDVASFIERLSNFFDQVLTHDVIVQLPGSTYIEGKSPDLAADFALVGLVAVIFRASKGEFNDEIVVIKFVGHLS